MRRLAALLCALLVLALPAAAQPDPFYEVEALNPGLSEPPADLDRETPQATLESFLSYAEEGNWDAAAHLLNLSERPEGAQAAQGPLDAQRLHIVLDRKVILNWSMLMDRPDALDANTTNRSATAGQVRRSLLMGVLDLGGRTVPIRLNRLKPEGGDPVWVFSRQTVENVPALFARYGPTAFEQALPGWARADAGAFKVWELIALPLTLILAFAAGAALHRAIRLSERRAGDGVAGIVLGALRWPATVAVATAVIYLATREVFIFSAAVDAFVDPLVAAGFVLAAIAFAMTVLDGILERLTNFDVGDISDPEKAETRSRATTLSAFRRIVLVVLAVAGTGWVLASADAFRTLGFSLLASAGAITIVLGFAARKVLGNIMSSLQIALNRSARIGDQILWDGQWCTVERIHFTYVQLKHWTGNRVVVPVSEFVSEGFTSYTLVEPGMTRLIPLRLAPTADIDALRERFHGFLAEEEDVDPDSGQCLVTEQDALGVTFRASFDAPDPSTGWEVECRLREKLVKALAEIEGRTDVPQFPAGAAADVAA